MLGLIAEIMKLLRRCSWWWWCARARARARVCVCLCGFLFFTTFMLYFLNFSPSQAAGQDLKGAQHLLQCRMAHSIDIHISLQVCLCFVLSTIIFCYFSLLLLSFVRGRRVYFETYPGPFAC